jgi:hypothetical protein
VGGELPNNRAGLGRPAPIAFESIFGTLVADEPAGRMIVRWTVGCLRRVTALLHHSPLPADPVNIAPPHPQADGP